MTKFDHISENEFVDGETWYGFIVAVLYKGDLRMEIDLPDVPVLPGNNLPEDK